MKIQIGWHMMWFTLKTEGPRSPPHPKTWYLRLYIDVYDFLSQKAGNLGMMVDRCPPSFPRYIYGAVQTDWHCNWFIYLECLSHYLTNLMHRICFTINFISCLHMFRAHVLETCGGMKWNLRWNKFCASSWLNSEINILSK